MKYKLIESNDNIKDTVERTLALRGIKNPREYAQINIKNSVNSYESLGIENLESALKTIIGTISKNERALIVVDCDTDGYTSAALLINYLHDLFPSWVENYLEFFLHDGKQHGLSDHINSILENDYSLVIIPDAGTNDTKYCEQLANASISVVILDHHEAECENPYAIIINNQTSDYPNKYFSGVGIVWQFCRYVDDMLSTNYADDYIDLVALGNCADMMSLHEYETKAIIKEGFLKKNIKNPFIVYMSDKNSYSLYKNNSEITPMGAAFYIIPLVNAITRSGTIEEKNIVFSSMLKHKAFEKILSNKRGHKEGEMEQLVLQAMRVCTNVKNRQTREEAKGLEFIEHMIEDKSLMDNQVLLFCLEDGAEVPSTIRGLVANKIMAKYQRPCCILTKVLPKDYENMDPESVAMETSFQGSARGCDKVGVTEFKDICSNTGYTSFVAGHQGAFGLGIYAENLHGFIEKTNEALKDMPNEPVYYVDYIFRSNEIDKDTILAIAGMGEYWGKDIDEPYIAIKGIKLTEDKVSLMGQKKNTLKIDCGGVNAIKFFANEEEYNKLCPAQGYIEIDLVGRCRANEYMGRISPQIELVDYEIVDSSKYIF